MDKIQYWLRIIGNAIVEYPNGCYESSRRNKRCRYCVYNVGERNSVICLHEIKYKG